MNVTLKEERKLPLPRSKNWSLWLHTWCRRSWDRVAHVQSCQKSTIAQCSNVQFSNVLCSNVQVLNTFREHLFRNFINFSRHQKQHLQKHIVAFTKILSWLRTKKISNADSTIYNDDSIKDSSLESKERFHLMILGQLGFNLLQYDPHLCRRHCTELQTKWSWWLIVIVNILYL